MRDTHPRDIILWFFLALLIASCFLLGWLLWPFISVIILGAVVTGVFTPIYRLINRKVKPSLASLLTCVIIFFVLFVPVSLFVGILANEAYDLYFNNFIQCLLIYSRHAKSYKIKQKANSIPNSISVSQAFPIAWLEL